ncbi:MAG: alpha/beta hydrolase [Planctomycetota bacterium]
MDLNVLLGLLNLLGAGAAAAWLAAVAHTAWSLLHPPKRTYAWALHRQLPGDPGELDPALDYEPFMFRGARRELPAWRVTGRNPSGPVVVMTHGWGSSRLGGLIRLPACAAHASAVILWDLPGQGEAGGIARMGADEHLDLIALLGTLGDVPIVLFGWSLGAGVSLRAALDGTDRFDIRAVICEAPYARAATPARNVIRLRGMPHRLNLRPAMWLIGSRLGVGPSWRGFARDRIASSLGDLPLTVIHGDADPVCPIDDGRRIADAAPNGRLVTIEGGGHNNLWTEPGFAADSAQAVQAAIREATDESA